ncbi:hypothetical protein GCM10023211_20410 [Orbus sasakiae]|uniref:NADH dehydrogenase subunit 6 n=1 Tax=Orbus sasakiae TaxID=1078475 RepID=A0ABP9NA33_9GAMM
MKSLLEYQNILWVIVVGVVLIIFGFYLYTELSLYEQSGSSISMPKMFRLFYEMFGKYVTVLFVEAVGVIALISGIWQLVDKVKNKKA